MPDKNKTQDGKYHNKIVLREVRKNEQVNQWLLGIQM